MFSGWKVQQMNAVKPPVSSCWSREPLQMFDPILDRLDVTEHHRRARLQAQFVRDLHHFEPLVALAFERRDSVAHAIHQNLAAAAGDRAEPGFLELRDHFPQWHPEHFGKVIETPAG